MPHEHMEPRYKGITGTPPWAQAQDEQATSPKQNKAPWSWAISAYLLANLDLVLLVVYLARSS